MFKHLQISGAGRSKSWHRSRSVRRPPRNLLENQWHRPGHAQPSGDVGPTWNTVALAREPIWCWYAPLLTPDL